MAKPEPFIVICFPEYSGETVRFSMRLLPKWVQLYILRNYRRWLKP